MGTSVKIGVIGAGSAVFSLGLIRDVCLKESLRGSTVTFMDIDGERLDMIHRLANRYAAELASDVTFEKTTELRGALRDADFVINTAAQGHAEEEAQRAVGEKHGYYRGVRLGNYHNLNLMMSVAHAMEDVCPDAWLIQSGNPVYDGCTLMTRETQLKIVGLCHGHFGYQRMAEVLGLDVEHVTCQAPGLNHVIYATHFEYHGKDAYPLLDEWIATQSEQFWATHRPEYGDNQMSRAAIDQYQMLGLMPIGDTVRIGGWQYHLDLPAKKHWYGWLGGFDSEIGWARYLQRLAERVDRIFKVAADSSRSVTQEFPPVSTTEQQVPIIDALVNNNRGEFQVNVPNRGAIAGIPDDVVVEVPALINRWGIQPIQVGRLPNRIMLHVIWPRILEMERNLEAYRTGDINTLRSMLLWDHRTRSVEQAEAVLEETLALPFNRDLADHFRARRKAAAPTPQPVGGRQ